ncbi:hypothetical protein COBT_002789 [Conglomerata obtusa]
MYNYLFILGFIQSSSDEEFLRSLSRNKSLSIDEILLQANASNPSAVNNVPIKAIGSRSCAEKEIMTDELTERPIQNLDKCKPKNTNLQRVFEENKQDIYELQKLDQLNLVFADLKARAIDTARSRIERYKNCLEKNVEVKGHAADFCSMQEKIIKEEQKIATLENDRSVIYSVDINPYEEFRELIIEYE